MHEEFQAFFKTGRIFFVEPLKAHPDKKKEILFKYSFRILCHRG
jgi:hypothetical protein